MSNNINKRLLPARYVPLIPLEFDNFTIKSGGKAVVSDTWDRTYNVGSLIAVENGINGLMDNWVLFHSLLFHVPLMIQTFQGLGDSSGEFKIILDDKQKYYAEEPIDYNNIGTAIYGNTCKENISYADAYKASLEINNLLKSAIKNYFLAYDIGFNRILRYIDISYWQIVMYISSIEALLPKPTFCKGKCSTCNKGIHHSYSDHDKELNELLFSKIKDKTIKKQYQSIIYAARRKIRNNTVHNGLFPTAGSIGSMVLYDGSTQYTTKEALTTYQSDHFSLELLKEQLEQICRYLFINEIIKKNIFPPLKGIIVHHVTFKPNETKTIEV